MTSIRSYNASNSTIIPPSRKGRRSSDSAKTEAPSRDSLKPPARRGYQAVPRLDVLDKLISRAVLAMQNGVFWERGSIINIVI